MKTLKIHVLLLGLVFSAIFTAGQTVIPAGPVNGNWDSAGSPYHIQGNIFIPDDSLLYIGPGTEIIFLGPYQLQVYGYLNASGTEGDSIFFSCPDSTGSWHGIRIIDFVQIMPDSIRLSYCSFSNARKNDPDSLGGAFYAKNSPRISIDNCTFRNCYSGSGGALYLRNSSVLIRDTEITGNAAERGGAVYLHQSSPDMVHLRITNNNGAVGGGIYFYNSAGYFANSVVAENTSAGGGGGLILHKASDVHMYECDINQNIAQGSGGGIAILEGSMPIIEYCNITYNQAVFKQYIAKGGGIFVTQHGNSPLIENTTISYNISADDGGGIYSESEISLISSLLVNNESNTDQGFGGGGLHVLYQRAIIINCTFSQNIAPQGSSVYATGADLDVYNSIFWDYETNEIKKIYMHNFLSVPTLKIDHNDLEGGENQIGFTGTIQLQWGENNIDENPSFVDPWSGLYALEDTSPCINTGLLDTLAFLLPQHDLAMNARVFGPAVDMGAYESQAPVYLREINTEGSLISGMYPIPARDYITIELRGNSNVISYDIISSSGHVVTWQLHVHHNNHLMIRVDGFTSGLYILRIHSQSLVESRLFSVIK